MKDLPGLAGANALKLFILLILILIRILLLILIPFFVVRFFLQEQIGQQQIRIGNIVTIRIFAIWSQTNQN